MRTETIAAFISTGLISLAPNLLLFLFPDFAANADNSPTLSVFLAMSAGGLLGDVFLHILPHAYEESLGGEHAHSNHDHHGHEDKFPTENHGMEFNLGLVVLSGFVLFFFCDICIRSIGSDGRGHQHGHKHGHSSSKDNKRSHDAVKQESPTDVFTSGVVLNLTADSLHNFTDGLAIGASFASSPTSHHEIAMTTTVQSITHLLLSRGGLASLSVLFHEIPHELGDYATLIKQGFSKRGAIKAQFVTAIAAFFGTAVGIYASQNNDGALSVGTVNQSIILPFTAGGFVYVAAVSIIPDMLDMNCSKFVRVLQLVAFGIGVGFMHFVSILEHSSGGEHHDHSHHHHHSNEL